MTYVVPTVLERSHTAFTERLTAVRSFFIKAQIDVLNNSSVGETSFADPDVIEKERGGLMFEVDLMVDIDNYDLSQWNRDWVEKIIFHIESSSKPRDIIKLVKSWNKKIFLSLNPETEIGKIESYRALADGIQFLAVQPGKSGNPFIPAVLDKVQALRTTDRKIDIEVDGGVSNDTLLPLLTAGANGFAVGSFFDNEHMEDRSFELLAIIERFELQAAKSKASSSK